MKDEIYQRLITYGCGLKHEVRQVTRGNRLWTALYNSAAERNAQVIAAAGPAQLLFVSEVTAGVHKSPFNTKIKSKQKENQRPNQYSKATIKIH